MSELIKGLIQAGTDVAYLKKDSKNDHFGYDYLSELAVKEKGWAALRKAGVALLKGGLELPYVSEDGENVIARVRLIVGNGAESAVWEGIGQGTDKGDKAAMKAQTAAYREAMKNGLGIAAGNDPEKDTTVDREALAPVVDSIKAAKSMKELEAFKKDIRGFKKGSAAYTQAVEVYKTKEKELKNG